MEILNQEKFIFSITYKKPEVGLSPDLTYLTDYGFDAVCKMIGSKLGLSWDQVGTKTPLRRHQDGTKSALSWHQVEMLLSFIETSRYMKEIMEVFGWSDRTKFREKYVTPLIEIGLIEMSQPDKPKSSKQQYSLSNKGKTFLDQLNAQMSTG